MLLKQGSAIRLVQFHSMGKIMTNILSTGLRMAGKTPRRGAVSAAMLLAVGTGSTYAGDLTILHINDHHSQLKPDGRMSLKLDGKSTRVRSAGIPAVVAKMKELQGLNQNVIKLHAGDAVSGRCSSRCSRARRMPR